MAGPVVTVVKANVLPLDSLSDVQITTPVINHVLVYDGTKWINGAAGTINLDSLSDVAVSAPASGQVIRYNGATWANANAFLDDLSDVVLTSVATNNVIQYNGTNWVNKATVDLTASADTDDMYTIKITVDTNNRWKVKGDGKIWWGPGSATQDTNLYRSATDMLATDDGITMTDNTKQFVVGSTASNATLAVQRTNASDYVLSSQVGSETNRRFRVRADGILDWAAGATSADVNLYRSAAHVLKTDDSLWVNTDITVVGAADIPGLYVSANRKTSGNTSIAAGAQAVHHSVTFTAVSGKTYAITWEGRISFSVAGSACLPEIRHASGSSITTGSTSVMVRQVAGVTNNGNIPFSVTAEFVASAGGTYTAGITFNFFSGSGTLTVSAATSDESYLRITRI